MHRHHRSSRTLRTSRRRFLCGTVTAAAILPPLGRFAWAQGGQVNVYNWDTYIGETTLEDFTEATGIDGPLRSVREQRGGVREAARGQSGL